MTEDERRETLERLMDEYGTALQRMCCLQLRDRALAEDAVQDTFLKAYKALGEFRRESSERTWLIRIAINTCRDYLRSVWFRRVDRRITPDELPETGEETPFPDDEVLGAVNALPQSLREVILIRYYQNLNIRETAETLRVSEATVKRRLKAANERLRLRLKGWYFDE